MGPLPAMKTSAISYVPASDLVRLLVGVLAGRGSGSLLIISSIWASLRREGMAMNKC